MGLAVTEVTETYFPEVNDHLNNGVYDWRMSVSVKTMNSIMSEGCAQNRLSDPEVVFRFQKSEKWLNRIADSWTANVCPLVSAFCN